MAVITDLEK